MNFFSGPFRGHHPPPPTHPAPIQKYNPKAPESPEAPQGPTHQKKDPARGPPGSSRPPGPRGLKSLLHIAIHLRADYQTHFLTHTRRIKTHNRAKRLISMKVILGHDDMTLQDYKYMFLIPRGTAPGRRSSASHVKLRDAATKASPRLSWLSHTPRLSWQYYTPVPHSRSASTRWPHECSSPALSAMRRVAMKAQELVCLKSPFDWCSLYASCAFGPMSLGLVPTPLVGRAW